MIKSSPVLAALALLARPCLYAADAPTPIAEIRVQGGSSDDQAYARLALGLRIGADADPGALQTALAAVRATDRFRTVTGYLEKGAQGTLVQVALEPWPSLEGWDWKGDAPPTALAKRLLPELRRGIRLGDLRLERARTRAQQRLRESGYPEASLAAIRGESASHLVLELHLGRPSLIQTARVEGEASYDGAALLHLAGIESGKSLWTQDLRRVALGRLRKRFVRDKRLEGRADFSFDEKRGALVLTVDPGPIVRLKAVGLHLGWTTSLTDLVPLAREDRYSPDLLDGYDRRLLRRMRNAGYLDARVSHRRDVVRTLAGRPEEVLITYQAESGPQIRIQGLRFEGSREIGSPELARIAALPGAHLGVGNPVATPELLDAVEDRIKSHYLEQGFTDVSLHRLLEHPKGKTVLVLQIREGTKRMIRSVRLELPPGQEWGTWSLGECLLQAFADHPMPSPGGTQEQRAFRSDRPRFVGIQAVLERLPSDPSAPSQGFRLTFARPVPFLKRDIAQVFTALRQQLAALGVAKPVDRIRVEEDGGATNVLIEVPPQPRTQLRRLVVQGSDATRSSAVMRELQVEAGMPLDPDRLARSQARVGTLGAFRRVDLLRLSEEHPATQDGDSWRDGDLLLRLEERSPWVVTSSFGYDKTQGYHVGLGLQRLNFMGMGRTLDFGIRAGDGTIHNPTLSKLFPTGDSDRSIDSYTVGYLDPWFSPSFLPSWLPDRTRYRSEAAYIQERHPPYLVRRRRVQNSWEWRASPNVVFQVGHRFERADVNGVGLRSDEKIDDNELNSAAHMPGHATISAPYIQGIWDTRDNAYDPTEGAYSFAKLEMANQLWGTSSNSSFVKLDLRQQWNWPVGHRAWAGVLMLGARVGMARATAASSEELPLSERFFAGGPYTQRGVEPDWLGPWGSVPLRYPYAPYDQQKKNGALLYQMIPLGGQGLALVNAEYRFPVYAPTFWGEVFVDSGQVYQSLKPAKDAETPFPPFRTSLGLGLILKFGIPIKMEYAEDWKRLRGRFRTPQEKETQLKSLLLSAGFQF